MLSLQAEGAAGLAPEQPLPTPGATSRSPAPSFFPREPSYLFESLGGGEGGSPCRVLISDTLIFRQVRMLPPAPDPPPRRTPLMAALAPKWQ